MAVEFEKFRDKDFVPAVSSIMPQELGELAAHLAGNIRKRLERFDASGAQIEVLGPDWSREHKELAGRMHADVIIQTYGSTYALPNKDPVANEAAIQSGDLDVYFMKIDGELSGTTCLVNTHDGRAELGRSAAVGASGASLILDYRILDWLTDGAIAEKYHTLFTTLRSAPNRDIDGFEMRGGQAVTEHWKKFPGLEVNGFGPLYLKHGSLEQFSCGSLTRAIKRAGHMFVRAYDARIFVDAWHNNYGLMEPAFVDGPEINGANPLFEAHYPPLDSGITEYVHADIVSNPDGKPLEDAIAESESVGSPFIQVVVPIDSDTRAIQRDLEDAEYQAFAYQPGTDMESPTLTYGKVSPDVSVVETFWNAEKKSNPFWRNSALAEHAMRVSARW